MAERRDVMALDLRLTILGLGGNKAADDDIDGTENRQYRSQTPILRQCQRNEANQSRPAVARCVRMNSSHRPNKVSIARKSVCIALDVPRW